MTYTELKQNTAELNEQINTTTKMNGELKEKLYNIINEKLRNIIVSLTPLAKTSNSLVKTNFTVIVADNMRITIIDNDKSVIDYTSETGRQERLTAYNACREISRNTRCAEFILDFIINWNDEYYQTTCNELAKKLIASVNEKMNNTCFQNSLMETAIEQITNREV